MDLSVLGRIANSCWFEIPNHFPFIIFGALVVMPNHVHGIVIINKQDDVRKDKCGDGRVAKFCDSSKSLIGTTPSSLKSNNRFGPQSRNLASIIRGFKVGVTKNARQINSEFAWQSRFHDHIIRNKEEYERISNYIIYNPINWKEDKFC